MSVFKKVLFVFFSIWITCVAYPVIAQQIVFEKTYGGPDEDRAASIELTSDGSFIIVGRTYSFGGGSADVYLLKTDSNGDILWTKTYGGSLWEVAYAVKETYDGGYIILGRKGFGFTADIWLIKTDANGDTMWTKLIGGPFTDAGYDIVQTADSGYAIAGLTENFGAQGLFDFLLIRTDVNGDTLWLKTYGGTSTDYAYTLQQTNDNGFIIGGYRSGLDAYVVRTDSLGDTLWTKSYGAGLFQKVRSIKQTSDGGFIIVGDEYLFIKTDANGNVQWSKSLYGNRATDVLQESDGGYLILSAIIGNVWLIRTDVNGDSLWTKNFGDPLLAEIGTTILRLPDGYIIAGYRNIVAFVDDDVYLLKIQDTSVGVAPIPPDSEQPIRVYPNPAQSNATLYVEASVLNSAELFFELYDLLGRQVIPAIPVNNHYTSFSLNTLNKGMYMYLLKDDTGVVGSGKLIVH